MLAGEINIAPGNAFLATSVAELEFAAGIINENPAHALGGRAEKVAAALPRLIRRPHQPQPGLVNERGGLERLSRRFTGHPVCRQLP